LTVTDAPRSVHFVAIGGTGMGSLAGLLKARGISVTGSDTNVYPPMSTLLEGWDIPVMDGFRAEHIRAGTDLFVIGNAVGPDNVEARAVIDGGHRYLSFPAALYELAISQKHSVVISGTHGKTTTTSLVGSLLLGTGADPSLLVGGYSYDFDGSFREGEGAHFVVEGDEYDTAFFDKTPKFLHYGARTLLISSVEFDHADIYRDLDHIKQAFRKLVAQMPADGTVVAAVDHAAVRDVVVNAPCRVIGYGSGDCAEWRAQSVRPEPEGTHFEIAIGESEPVPVWVPLFGAFNIENALGALAVVSALEVPLRDSVRALTTFRGVKRRQEVRGVAQGVTVIDDFAHHPTAVRGSIAAVRDRFPGSRVIAVFEPRTNTSRRAIFQSDYVDALEGADRVFVRELSADPIYSATGPVTEFFSTTRLAADLEARGVPAVCRSGLDEIVPLVAQQARSGDVILCMSNGSFDNIWQRLLDALGKQRGPG
jgi:UDP-N-acetylmuramate: L-alanyl-gamma-D-glutamyl-meso-diaminopimelate ligase